VIILAYHSPSGRKPVEDFLRGLSKHDQAKFREVYEGIQENGFEYHGADFRQLDGKLWEIKFRSQGGGYRIAYVVLVKDQMVWLHVFKKSGQKTRKEDMEIALRRMKEVLK
jgi:phage-related protein